MLTKDELKQLDNLVAARNKTMITLIIGEVNSVKVELKAAKSELRSEIIKAKTEVKEEFRADIKASEDSLRKDMATMEDSLRKEMATKQDIERLEVKIDKTTDLQKQVDKLTKRLDHLESVLESVRSKN